MQQIFTNLLGNAVKFTPEGGEIVVRGSLDKSPKRDDLNHLIFSVQDNGVGVPPEGESKLFQLFSQCDTSTTRVFGGTGLGLAISKVSIFFTLYLETNLTYFSEISRDDERQHLVRKSRKGIRLLIYT